MNKICTHCKKEKEASTVNFAYRSKAKGTFVTICKPCWKIYHKAHYEANKQTYIDKSKDWRLQRRIEFYTWLKTQQCKDCGNKDFRVLEFDHLSDKHFDVSKKMQSVLLETLMIEINKCDVVCKNCHVIRTAERGNFYNYLI
jgi:hypothetical protein